MSRFHSLLTPPASDKPRDYSHRQTLLKTSRCISFFLPAHNTSIVNVYVYFSHLEMVSRLLYIPVQ